MKNAVMMGLWLLVVASMAQESESDGLRLTYLANEGVLLQSGSGAVLIDAFVVEPYSIYACLNDSTWERMLEGKAPFEKVDLALVSHRHRDHFQAEAAVAFMLRHGETVLVSSPEVVGDLARQPGFDAIRSRVETILPEPGAVLTRLQAGFQISFLRIKHGGQAWQDLQNLGHLIRAGGMSLLHIGDAETSASAFAGYVHEIAQVDIALVPYWFYLSASGRAVVADVINPHQEVAVHIPVDRAEAETEFRVNFPGVTLPGPELGQYTPTDR